MPPVAASSAAPATRAASTPGAAEAGGLDVCVMPVSRPCTASGSEQDRLAFRRGLQNEPVEAVPRQREQVAELPDRREVHAAHALHRSGADKPAEVKLDRLRKLRQIID